MVLIYLLLILVYLICLMLLFSLYMSKTGVGFCRLLCSAVIADVLPASLVIRLTSS